MSTGEPWIVHDIIAFRVIIFGLSGDSCDCGAATIGVNEYEHIHVVLFILTKRDISVK